MAMQDFELAQQDMQYRFRTVRNGQIAALVVTLVFLVIAAYLIVNGFQVAGTILGGIDLVALATAFLAVGRDQRKLDE